MQKSIIRGITEVKKHQNGDKTPQKCSKMMLFGIISPLTLHISFIEGRGGAAMYASVKDGAVYASFRDGEVAITSYVRFI